MVMEREGAGDGAAGGWWLGGGWWRRQKARQMPLALDSRSHFITG
ncbi:hypothetical protein E2C01_089917 [Portunus trituberculatus]|uniref:Uncharacterized protein n=1 Tax=Portunus trituberculatus TaxID=210409 RepID=A0A5B7JKJ8_PORTR|nr:hypothetical protein [Portunus trituberculatus]